MAFRCEQEGTTLLNISRVSIFIQPFEFMFNIHENRTLINQSGNLLCFSYLNWTNLDVVVVVVFYHSNVLCCKNIHTQNTQLGNKNDVLINSFPANFPINIPVIHTYIYTTPPIINISGSNKFFSINSENKNIISFIDKSWKFKATTFLPLRRTVVYPNTLSYIHYMVLLRSTECVWFIFDISMTNSNLGKEFYS